MLNLSINNKEEGGGERAFNGKASDMNMIFIFCSDIRNNLVDISAEIFVGYISVSQTNESRLISPGLFEDSLKV